MSSNGPPFKQFDDQLKRLVAKGYGIPGYTIGEKGFRSRYRCLFRGILMPRREHFVQELFDRFDRLGTPPHKRLPRASINLKQVKRWLKATQLPPGEVEILKAKLKKIKEAMKQQVTTYCDALDRLWVAFHEVPVITESAPESTSSGSSSHEDDVLLEAEIHPVDDSVVKDLDSLYFEDNGMCLGDRPSSS